MGEITDSLARTVADTLADMSKAEFDIRVDFSDYNFIDETPSLAAVVSYLELLPEDHEIIVEFGRDTIRDGYDRVVRSGFPVRVGASYVYSMSLFMPTYLREKQNRSTSS